jgi:hypothetical protein
LHETVLDAAEKLLATFPAEIGHVMFTCTGSEANDLALRVARTCTGGTGFIVTDNACHGVTSALAELSPSLGLPASKDSHARLVPAPNPATDGTGEIFARHIRDALDDMERKGIRPAGLLSRPSSATATCRPAWFHAARGRNHPTADSLFTPTKCSPARRSARRLARQCFRSGHRWCSVPGTPTCWSRVWIRCCRPWITPDEINRSDCRIW